MSESPEAAGLDVSRETRARLEQFVALLRKWSARINLVSPRSLETVWQRHVADSAQLLPLAPPQARSWIDLGSGAGFPGLIVASLARETRPDLRVTCVESDSRKCAFMRTAIRDLGLNADVKTERIERLAAQPHDVVSARALAPLERLLELSEPLCGPGTIRLFPKGATAHSELTEARRSWHIQCRSHQSRTAPDAVILEIQEAARVPEPRS